MEMKLLLIVIVSSIVIYATFLLAREYVTMQTKLKSLDERLQKLESSNRKRMPYEAMDALLDAMSTVEVMEREEAFKLSLLENLKAHITNSMAVGTKREEK